MNTSPPLPVYTPWIVCAAIRHPESKLIIAGARHYDEVMRSQVRHQIKTEDDEQKWHERTWWAAEQGFIDQKGRFYSREEALVIAQANGQIRRAAEVRYGQLFSEALY
jgi:hypothetical protein